MKKISITSFIAGALIFGSVGVFAGQYTATENTFPIQLNGSNVSVDGYNINGSTYFKLRDIADTVGGFSVDFQNNTILLAKDGYIYSSVPAASEDARKIIMAFTVENHTGIDFPKMLLAPVTVDITQTTNIFPEDFVFTDGSSINLDSGDSPDTTLFNLAAVASDGKGYLFQNIDLSTNRFIQLYIIDGVPKAIIN